MQKIAKMLRRMIKHPESMLMQGTKSKQFFNYNCRQTLKHQLNQQEPSLELY